MLEKKEKVLLKKAGTEVEKAKDYTRSKNKRGMTVSKYLQIIDCNQILANSYNDVSELDNLLII